MQTDAEASMATTFIASSGRRVYLPSSMVRFLSSLFVAIALFLSPLAMASGAGMAMSHAGTAAMGAADHCAGGESPLSGDESSIEISCASSCAAYSSSPLVAAEKFPILAPKPRVMKSQRLAGIQPEGETPPPRITPEI